MTTIFQVLINGEVKLTVPGFIKDGFVWGNSAAGPTPLINSVLLAEKGLTAADLKKAVSSGKFSEKLRECFMVVGDNSHGRTVVNKTEADRIEHEEWKANRTPADLRREELAILWDRVNRCDRSQDDVEYQQLRGKAIAAQDKFYAEFPSELKKDQADRLRAKAEDARRLASGALVYDADGWISSAEQDKRAAEFRAEAAEFDRQADELEK